MARYQNHESPIAVEQDSSNMSSGNYSIEPIAVIGLSFVFPQDIKSTEDLWRTMMERRSTATPFPKDRMNPESVFHPDTSRRGQDLANFDAAFFALSTTDASAMDPQQRLLLESTYKALENAGIPMEQVAGSRTSVYTGNFTNDWLHLAYKDGEQCQTTTSLGVQASFNANRISWFFDFQGNSANIDTACSSSLVCLDLACQGLRSGADDMSVVAGSNVIISPDTMHGLTNLNMLSPDGQCYSFDHRANGYSRGEGVAVLIVKRLSDAIRDHNTIRGIVRSTGCNQDGHTPSITIPNHMSQEKLIRDTYRKVNLSMTPTRYFEAHGTGTPVGDPIECRAIGAAFKQARSVDDPLWIGALKSNIGHLEGASGIAGVIKAILVLEKAIIPPNANLEKVNSDIDTELLRIEFPQVPIPWPVRGLRRASVNSFGNAGTNAHVILDDVYHYLQEAGLQAAHLTIKDPPSLNLVHHDSSQTNNITRLATRIKSEITNASPRLLIFSARDVNGIQRLSHEYASYYRDMLASRRLGSDYLEDLAFTLCSRRSSLDWKSYAVIESTDKLQDMGNLLSVPQKSLSAPQLAFVFTGQGAQWAGMARELTQYSIFRQSLHRSQEHLTELGCSWQLEDEMFASDNESRLSLAEVSQPVCTAVQLALVDLLRSFDIHPTAVVGHSSGEIAAAYCTGSIAQESAIEIAYYRGILVGSKVKNRASDGAMMAVGLSRVEIIPYLQQVTSKVGGCDLTVACINSNRSITISGLEAHINVLKDILEYEHVLCRKLSVDVAYHSPYMQTISAAYLGKLRDLKPGTTPPRPVTMFSSVTGRRVDKTQTLSPEYWNQNLVSPVLFSDAITNLFSTSTQKVRKKLDLSHRNQLQINAILEVGPHSTLRRYVLDVLSETIGFSDAKYIPVLLRDRAADQTLLEAMGFINCLGYSVDVVSVNQLHLETTSRVTLPDLPAYVFDHSKRYWDETRLSRHYRTSQQGKLDLLGKPINDWNDLEPRWRNFLRISEMPWIEEHIINKSLVYPGAGMLVAAIEAANQISSSRDDVEGFELHDVTFLRPLKISRSSLEIEIQLSLQLRPDDSKPLESWSRWRLFAYEMGTWSECCQGNIRVRYIRGSNEVDGHENSRAAVDEKVSLREQINASCRKSLDVNAFYEAFNQSGLGLGKSFQRILSGSFNDHYQVIATIKPFEWPSEQFPQPHIVHPTTLDCLFHLSFAGLNEGGSRRMPTMIPTSLQKIFVSMNGLSDKGTNKLTECAWLRSRDDRVAAMDGFVLNTSGDQILMEFEDLRTTEIAQNTEQLAEHDGEAGLMPYHIEYRPDVDFIPTTFLPTSPQRTDGKELSSLDQYISLLAYKRAGLGVLMFSSSKDSSLCQAIKSRWNKEVESPSICGSFRSLGIASFSELTLEKAKEELMDHSSLTLSLVETRQTLAQQGLQENFYDLVLLHVSTDIRGMPLGQIRNLVKPEGKLVLLSEPNLSRDLTTLPTRSGFTFSGLQLYDYSADSPNILSANVYQVSSKVSSPMTRCEVYLIIEPASSTQRTLASCLTGFLSSKHKYSIQTLGLEEASRTKASDTSIFIVLLEIDQPVLFSLSPERYKAIQKLFTSVNHVMWLNLAGGTDAGQPEYAMITGLARALRCEFDNLKVTVVSFTNELDTLSQTQMENLELVLDRNHTSPLPVDEDVEYVEIDGCLNIARVCPAPQLAKDLAARSMNQRVVKTRVEDAPPLELSIGSHGLFDTLMFTEDTLTLRPLESDEVEVDVKAIGINFRDCLIALGRLPGGKLGQECAGTVVRAGSATNFIQGDRVLLLHPGLFRTVARCKAESVFKIPDNLPFNIAATIPTQFATSWVAVHSMARLQPTESILIHVGASGTGQAAIQMSHLIGATVFTTVSSEKKKRLLMHEYGVREDHILFSRDTGFADAVKRLTKGRGVDVVLNSLAGDSLLASWECLAPHGRFIEIGKKDIMANSKLPMLAFQKNASFQALDFGVWFEEKKAEAHAGIEHLITMFTDRILSPPRPLRICSMAEVKDVFQTIQSGVEPGKYVIEIDQHTEVLASLRRRPDFQLDPDARYVVAGGLGGIGRATARWLVSRGAKDLILLSRYGPRTEAARQLIDELRGRGVRVEAPACDITDASRVQEILGRAEKDSKPIKGCIQATIIAKDCLFPNLSFPDWHAAVTCKTHGSLNLHTSLPPGLDFFILLSSASGLTGIKGQTNYDAANTYEDAFARHRVSHGEKATVFDLGAMTDDGILAENPTLLTRVLAYGSLEPVTRDRYYGMLDYYCNPSLPLQTPTTCQVAIGLSQGTSGSLEDYARRPQALIRPLARITSHTLTEGGSGGTARIDGKRLLALSPSFDAAVQSVTHAVVQKLAMSLSTLQPPDATIDTNQPLQLLGVDSLLAIELRNWLVKEFAAEIAVFETQGAATLESLSVLVVGRSGVGHPLWRDE